jgi:hypothetical protein
MPRVLPSQLLVRRSLGYDRQRTSMTFLGRPTARIAVAVDRRLANWYRFPTPEQIALLKGMLDKLPNNSLFHPIDGEQVPDLEPIPKPRWLTERTIDGSYNDLAVPAMGHPRSQTNSSTGCSRCMRCSCVTRSCR